jgi:hypothetical protein
MPFARQSMGARSRISGGRPVSSVRHRPRLRPIAFLREAIALAIESFQELPVKLVRRSSCRIITNCGVVAISRAGTGRAMHAATNTWQRIRELSPRHHRETGLLFRC